MNKKLLLLGSGGHCQSVLDAVLSQGQFDPYLIDNCSENQKYGIPILGDDSMLGKLYKNDYKYAFVAVGSVGTPEIRQKLTYMLYEIGFTLPNIIDKSAIIAGNVSLGDGIFIGKGVIINAYSQLASNCIINTGSIIEHGCRIGNFAHIAPGSTLCGNVSVEENTHIGAGSVVIQNISIGENSLIGAGSVVIKNIGRNLVAYGNPCKIINSTFPA